MGCWNGTCGVTQLPITYGEPVVAVLVEVPLHRSGGYSGHCYTEGSAYPITLPFYGEYNDYGGVQNIQENYNIKLIRLKYGKEGSFEDFINDTVERDVLVIKRPSYIMGDIDVGVGLWMAHRWAFESLLKLPEEWAPHGRPLIEILSRDAEHYLNWMDEAHDRLQDTAGDIRELQQEILRALSSPHSIPSDTDWGNMFVSCCLEPDGEGSTWTSRAFHIYREFLRDLYRNGGARKDYPDIRALVKDAVDFALFQKGMSALRKSWEPQGGKGSQHRGYKAHQQFLTDTLAYVGGKVSKEGDFDGVD